MKNKKYSTVGIDDKLLSELKLLGKERCMTVSALVNTIISSYLSDLEDIESGGNYSLDVLAIDFKNYLEKEGYNVTSYYNGDTAIKDSDKVYHLWILDIMLGDDISGYDIIKKIRENNSDVPVIFTSARDKDLDKIIGLELGSDDYMSGEKSRLVFRDPHLQFLKI